MSNLEEKDAVYFTSLEIENVKCFGTKQLLKLTDSNGAVSPWTLILGDNGFGKTTLLKCLAWMTPVRAPDLHEGTENAIKRIKPLMDEFENESEHEKLVRLGSDVTTMISATFSNGVKLGTNPSADSTVSIAMNFKRINNELKVITPDLAEIKEFITPALYAYGASRHMARDNFDDLGLKDSLSNLFSESADLYDADQILTNLEYSSMKEKDSNGKITQLLDKLKIILRDILPAVKTADSILIHAPFNEDGAVNKNRVEIKTDDGNVPLFDLSLGYKTMLAWTLDLAVRMLWQNPDKDNPLEQPAIVIIDEIDLHLHPKWQRIVREHLTHHFPKTQFICTAHGPFMAQSSEFENLCVVNRNEQGEVFIENEPLVVKGWRIGQIATSDLFGISSERSLEVEGMFKRRRELLDEKEENLTAKDKTDLIYLNDQILALPILENNDDQKFLDQIRKLLK